MKTFQGVAAFTVAALLLAGCADSSSPTAGPSTAPSSSVPIPPPTDTPSVTTPPTLPPSTPSSTPTAGCLDQKLAGLTPRERAAQLIMTGMPGMADHPPMPIKGLKTSVAGGGKTMIIQPPRPLAAGTYQLKWHAVAGDTHRITGAFSFKVK